MKSCIFAVALACVGMAGASLTASVHINGTSVKITMTGPADKWFAIAFGGTAEKMMDSYAIIAQPGQNGMSVLEHKLGDNVAGNDLSTTINVMSNTVTGADRTIVMKRALAGATTDHFTFPSTAGAIPAIWAKSTPAGNFPAYHGSAPAREPSWTITSTEEAAAAGGGATISGVIRATFPDVGLLMAFVALFLTLGVMPTVA